MADSYKNLDYTASQIDGILGEVETAKGQSPSLAAALAAKQDVLTFDSTPTSGSSNPVTSDGIYTKLLTYAKADMSNAATATKTAKGAVKLSSAFNSDSESMAATPYTIKVLSEAIANVVDSGAKNVMPYDLDAMKSGNASAGYTWSGNVCTISDGANLNITVTVNEDGTITCEGSKPATSSGLNFRIVPAANAFDIPIGDYVLSGCPPLGTSATYQLRALINNSSVFAQDIGEGASFTTTSKTIQRLEIAFGTAAISNMSLTFSPMICLQTMWNISHRFVPHVPTNQQLYDMIQGGA